MIVRFTQDSQMIQCYANEDCLLALRINSPVSPHLPPLNIPHPLYIYPPQQDAPTFIYFFSSRGYTTSKAHVLGTIKTNYHVAIVQKNKWRMSIDLSCFLFPRDTDTDTISHFLFRRCQMPRAMLQTKRMIFETRFQERAAHTAYHSDEMTVFILAREACEAQEGCGVFSTSPPPLTVALLARSPPEGLPACGARESATLAAR